jgi:hypothetical protein
MKRHTKLFAFILCVFFAVAAFAVPAQNVAITYKVKGSVELFKSGAKSAVALTPATHLSDGDKIRTGKDGYCFLIFVEDKTQIKVRENSEMTISANRGDKGLEQQVNMNIGQIWSHVSKEGSKFRVSTPTSVASVKGTMWWTLVNEDGTTTIIGLSGIVNLFNNRLGQSEDVGAGQTGDSGPGGLHVGPTHISIPNPDGPGSTRTLRIPFRDADGNDHNLYIDYEE